MKGILFDLDGTLIDSTEAILESFHRSFDFYGHSHPVDDAIKALIGHPLDVMYRELGVDEEQVWNFVSTYKEHYREISKQKTLMLPDAFDAIKLASEQARLGIVTTKTGRYSKELLEHFGVMHYFEVLIGREDVQRPKPHPEPIFKAMARMNAKTDTVWMIGDTRLDIAAANAAGVKSVGVLSGYDNEEQLLTLCDFVEKNALNAVQFIFQSVAKRDVCPGFLNNATPESLI